MQKNTELLVEGCWVQCPDCEDAFCTVHDKHAWECDCPGIEVWADQGMNPYDTGEAK